MSKGHLAVTFWIKIPLAGTVWASLAPSCCCCVGYCCCDTIIWAAQ